MKHGKYRKALASFTALQTTPLVASGDFMYAHAQLDFESQLMRSSANEHEYLGERIRRRDTKKRMIGWEIYRFWYQR